MEQPNDTMEMLDLLTQPGFCVRDCLIQKVNRAAQLYLLTPGMDVRELLLTGEAEYAEFKAGCLYLSLQIGGQTVGASVTKTNGYDVFLLDQAQDQSELQAMALAARELREPLSGIMMTAERLFPLAPQDSNAENTEQIARLNRGLYRMMRIIGNMSDAGRYCAGVSYLPETVEISAFFRELFEKNSSLIEHTGIHLHYEGLDRPLFCVADSEKLERAVLNILSNAVKFTPKGGHIEVKLIRTGSLLRLSVLDSGEGIPENIRSSVYTRYLRHPAIEDSRYGIGLGMVLIRSTAALHGGTVLIDRPENGGTRITMTISLHQASEHLVRSPRFRVDYAGEHDHSLIELAEILPLSDYDGSF